MTTPPRRPVSTRHAFALAFDLALRRDPHLDPADLAALRALARAGGALDRPGAGRLVRARGADGGGAPLLDRHLELARLPRRDRGVAGVPVRLDLLLPAPQGGGGDRG